MTVPSRAQRIRRGLETYFSSAREDGRAVLANISSSGALLERTRLRPTVDTPVRVTIFVPNQAEPLTLVGRVVRHTEAGFALEFERPDPDIYEVVTASGQPD